MTSYETDEDLLDDNLMPHTTRGHLRVCLCPLPSSLPAFTSSLHPCPFSFDVSSNSLSPLMVFQSIQGYCWRLDLLIRSLYLECRKHHRTYWRFFSDHDTGV